MSSNDAGEHLNHGASQNSVTRGLKYLCFFFEPISLSIWLGGLLVIGAIVAPVAFHTLRTASILAGNLSLQNTMAGSIVGASLRVLNFVSTGCFVLLLISIFAVGTARGHFVPLLSLIGSEIITLFQQFYIFPRLDLAQAAAKIAQFNSLHQMYVNLTYIELLFLALFAYTRSRARLDYP